MKKKVLIIGGIILAVIVVVLFVLLSGPKYTVVVSPVDDNSPDRILTVYNGEKEKIEVKRIEYMDGVLLCNGVTPAAHYGDVENEKYLIVVLEDGNKIKAKVVLEEVK